MDRTIKLGSSLLTCLLLSNALFAAARVVVCEELYQET
jgi:hypothetical protein